MSRYPTQRAVSAGGLVVQDRADGRWGLLIARRSAMGKLQWTLPKGGIEPGEAVEDAAVREVREETGIHAAIIEGLGVVDYWFLWHPDGVRYHKYVHYYVMRPLHGHLHERDDEAEHVAWLPLGQALERMAHLNERKLVASVRGRALQASAVAPPARATPSDADDPADAAETERPAGDETEAAGDAAEGAQRQQAWRRGAAG